MREKRMVTLHSSSTGMPLVRDKQQRNTPCDCGSGRKCKKCCGATLKYFDTGKVKQKLEAPIPEPTEIKTLE